MKGESRGTPVVDVSRNTDVGVVESSECWS